MARLPQIARENPTTPIITSGVSGAEIASPYRAIADAMAGVGDVLIDKGAQAEKAAAAGYLARVQTEARNIAQKLAIDANGNAETFQTSWDSFRTQFISKQPAKYQDALDADLIELGGERYRGIVGDRFEVDIRTSKASLSAELALLDDEASALARAGGSDGPEYQSRKQKIYDIYRELYGNPAFQFSKEEAEIELRRLESRHMAEGIVGNIDRTYRTKGVAEAEAEARRLLWDTDLDLTPEERRTYTSRAIEYLQTSDAERKAQLEYARGQATEIKNMLKSDARLVDDAVVDQTMGALAALGDAAGALELATARAGARFMGGAFAEAGDAGQVQLYKRMFSAPQGQAPQGAAAIIRAEEGFRPGAYWDVNAFRTGFGSDTVTTADGRIFKVDEGTKVTREDAERDLARRTGEFAASAAIDVGQDRWNAFPDNVRSALTSVAYNYGSLPSTVVAAAKSGDIAALAVAVGSLSSNPERRAREAAIILGGQLPSSFYSPASDPATVKLMRDEITADFNTHWDQIKGGIGMNLPPSAEEMNLLADQLAIIDDPAKRKEVADFFEQHASGYLLSNMSPAEGEALINRLRSDPEGGGFAVAQMAAIKAAEDARAAQKAALAADPIGFGIRNLDQGAPPEINFGDPQSIIAGLAARQRIADVVGQRFETGPVSALQPGDAQALKTAYEGGNFAQKAALLNAMVQGLRPETLMATLATFADQADTRGLAVAGAIMSQNPQAAGSILRGYEALKANPKFGYDPGDATAKEFRDEYFPATVVPPEMVGAWQAHLDAARAAYADISASSGDTSGVFEEDRFQQAVDLVTGGLVEFRGQKTFAPAHGVTQSRFDAVMAGLPEDVFRGVRTPDGSPITASFVRKFGVLVGYGDGRYLVKLGDEITSPYAMQASRGLGDFGGPFVLDLRPHIETVGSRTGAMIGPP